MRTGSLALVVCAALAGCADGAPSEANASGGYNETLHASLAANSIMLVAFRALDDTVVRYEESQQLSGEQHAGAHFQVGWTGLDADVPGLLAAARGEAPVPTFWFGSGGGGAGGGGGASAVPTVRYDGTTLYSDGGGRWSASGHGHGSGSLEKGQWLLVVAGMCGHDPTQTEGHWTWTISADGPMEKVVLPSATMVCGAGFDEYPATNIGPLHAGAITQRWPAEYGATVKVMSFFDAMPPQGEWVLPDETLPMTGGWWSQRSLTSGEMGFDVTEHRGSRAVWSLQGLPFIA